MIPNGWWSDLAGDGQKILEASFPVGWGALEVGHVSVPCVLCHEGISKELRSDVPVSLQDPIGNVMLDMD